MRRALLLMLALAWGIPVLGQTVPGPTGQTLIVNTALPMTCTAGQDVTMLPGSGMGVYFCTAVNTWTKLGFTSQFPSGAIMFIASGTCPTGFTEVSALNGKMWRGTVAANGNVGTTGGADSVTPTFTGNSVTSSAVSAGTPAGTNGTVSITPLLNAIAWPAGVPTFAGSSSTTSAQVFTGSSATSSAVSGGTPAGTNGASATTGNCAATNVLIGTGAANACKATAPNLAVSAQTFTGSALGTHTHTLTATGTNATGTVTPSGTVAWPAGVPTVTGAATTVGAETFTGSALGTHTHTTTATGAISAVDTRAAYLLLIACSKD